MGQGPRISTCCSVLSGLLAPLPVVGLGQAWRVAGRWTRRLEFCPGLGAQCGCWDAGGRSSNSASQELFMVWNVLMGCGGGSRQHPFPFPFPKPALCRASLGAE